MAIGESWGRTFKASHKLEPRNWMHSPLPSNPEGQSILAYGMGKVTETLVSMMAAFLCRRRE